MAALTRVRFIAPIRRACANGSLDDNLAVLQRGRCTRQRPGAGPAAAFCPVTSQVKGYPFEVAIPPSLPVGGAILSDQIKSLDWRARRAELMCRVPKATTLEVLHKLATLVGPPHIP